MFRQPGDIASSERECPRSHRGARPTGAGEQPAPVVFYRMGFFDKIFGKKPALPPAGALNLAELSRRLGVDAGMLSAIKIVYQPFTIPKRNGEPRQILAPAADLKNVQRLILRCILKKLNAHDAVHGFERGRSIVTNARVHVGAAVVLRLDLKDFFPSTSSARVESYFRAIGWDAECAAVLTKVCTHENGLPQGAPTSPRLSNLVNYRLDTRLAALGRAYNATYTRYADDLTFSVRPPPGAVFRCANILIHDAKQIVSDEGYRLHTDRKLKIHRKHDSQRVTGLVVNQIVQLPRETRRRLRAIEHHLKTGKPATLSTEQMQGWDSLRAMIVKQRELT